MPLGWVPGQPVPYSGMVKIGANRIPAEVLNSFWDSPQRAGAAFTIRAPDVEVGVVLWSQYHALKALAVRLDAGIGAERERIAFEAGLREYDRNFDRIAAQRKALPG
jgi:hypothetical protein